MLDEEMDHIIRDAAEKHHPPYNDKAWEMMEKKLDKHLPQKKDRRKFIFFLLFFLLLGGATVFTVTQFSGGKAQDHKNVIAENKTAAPVTKTSEPGNNDVTVNSNSQNANKTIAGNANTPVSTSVTDATTNSAAIPGNPANPSTKPVSALPAILQNSVDAKTSTLQQPDFAFDVKTKPGNNKKSNFKNKGKSNTRIGAAAPADDFAKQEAGKAENNKGVKKIAKGKLHVTVSTPDLEKDESEFVKAAPSKINSDVITSNAEKKETGITIEDVKDKKEKDLIVTEDKSPAIPGKKNPRKNVAGNFGLTFSAGPDVSFVSLNNTGKTNITYGAGISYQFGKRVTVRSGFYVSKKKYTATPGQYHNVVNPNLYEVGADCKVYEIPLSISYNFAQQKNHNWFGNVGLSTFLMKKEDYDYRYKTATGYTYNYKHGIANENEHYFAVLTLSGGYQYQFNKRVSLQAEPYINLPLRGIGLGKIKLNSSGILFTATVKPFAKNN